MKENPLSTFKELDAGTLFTAVNFWEETDDTTSQKYVRQMTGTWAWEDVKSVLTMMEPSTFDEVPGPKCSLCWNDGFIHLIADYQEVLTAYRRWRLRYKRALPMYHPTVQ
ncbi:hypothetical protein [Hymenobacter nivis]|uniref:Uncharacterized protein n=1 Tax=Hymenobacter nivis TaxID=1850093 RepID=A0A502GXX6_9BACT|nr:hypothetical protein [Hymenobacter nivis]TPG66070.1 hypothetical protein EAH73_11920 [Hymenobacter nivis]